MSPHKAQFSRITAFRVTAISGTVLGILFAWQMVTARVAKQAVIAQETRVASQPNPNAGAGSSTQPTPVLVELFTSEGCSSCPSADSLLARLQQQQPVPGAQIIALEEHVDYWESLGWHDRFSSRQFTDRQSGYAQSLHLSDDYTPQMVIDGVDQFVGNDSSHALRAIAQAARTPKLALKLSPPTLNIGRIDTSVVSIAAAGLPAPKADLYAALVETTASTQVLHGENGGRVLHHVSVVRALQKIGTSDELANPLFFSFTIPKDAVVANLRTVVFAQRSGQGAIIAAASSVAPMQP
jgi:hypothetical protein